MAHILIVAENMRHSLALTAILRAAGHDMATTADSVLAFAALRVSRQRLIVLPTEGIRIDVMDARDLLDGVTCDEIGSPNSGGNVEHLRHTYILLTKLSPEKLPEGVHTLLTSGGADVVDLNCSIGTLLAAIELASERLPLDEGMRAVHGSSNHTLSLRGLSLAVWRRGPVSADPAPTSLLS
jgi:hypothetical protein